MGKRVDKITISMTVYTDFAGSHDWSFSYIPADDDPLVELAYQKHEEMLKTALLQGGGDMPGIG